MKVLIAEDDRSSRNLLKLALKKWGHDVVATEDGRQAWNELKNEKFHLVISDWMMPDIDGPTLCQKIRKADFPNYVYVILLTGKKDIDDIVQGMSSGADDYLVKPFDFEELKVRVRAGKRIIDLEQRLSETQRELEILASTDGLTGLLNRREVMARFEREMARCIRSNKSIGVIMADIDHFKTINDTHGHSAGDVVLKAVSNRLLQAVRPYDSVGRFGGEEFLMVLPESDTKSATEIAERLKDRVGTKEIKIDDRNSIKVTASFGVSALLPSDVNQRDNLIKQADQALYEAKELGRNRVVTNKKIDG